MQENKKKKITLAIETAVAGGSLSLVKDGRVVDLWIGGDDVSRSEDLLVGISDILARNSVDKSDIAIIAVSTGPGSYTGIRVGISTALGFKNSLGAPCAGFQVLEAMMLSLPPHAGQTISAIPVGRGEVCRQSFGAEGSGPLYVEKLDSFVDFLAANSSIRAVLHEKLYSQLSGLSALDVELNNAGIGLAGCIGLAAQNRESGSGLTPVYVRDFI